MSVRYPLLFSNIPSFPSEIPLYTFWLRHILLYRTFTRTNATSPLYTQGSVLPFSLCRFSIPSTGNRQDSPTLIHRTRRLSALRPLKSTAKAALWVGRTAYPLVPFPSCQRTACFLSLVFFPASCRNKPSPVLSGGQVLSNQNPPRSVLPRLFRDRFLSKSSSLFRCKVSMQTGTTMRP